MSVAITNARWENSPRGRGVTFDAESTGGKGEFLVAAEALADLARGHDMKEADFMESFESHSQEISEAAGRHIAAGTGKRGVPTIITTEDLPSLR